MGESCRCWESSSIRFEGDEPSVDFRPLWMWGLACASREYLALSTYFCCYLYNFYTTGK